MTLCLLATVSSSSSSSAKSYMLILSLSPPPPPPAPSKLDLFLLIYIYTTFIILNRLSILLQFGSCFAVLFFFYISLLIYPPRSSFFLLYFTAHLPAPSQSVLFFVFVVSFGVPFGCCNCINDNWPNKNSCLNLYQSLRYKLQSVSHSVSLSLSLSRLNLTGSFFIVSVY